MRREKPNLYTNVFKLFLEELATYVSLLTPLFTAGIVAWGVTETRYSLLLISILPVSLGAAWLFIQYPRAKGKLKRGVDHGPAWFWRFVTNKIPHVSEQVQESPVMVFIPPHRSGDASTLAEEYNTGGSHILLFHHIPTSVDGAINEEEGRISHDGETRSLRTLADEMDACVALVLLDDTRWDEYEQTEEVIADWTKKYPARPVMAVRLGGRGTLNLSWNRLEDLIEPSRSLRNRLLVECADRGTRWFLQARRNRRIVLWGLSLSLISSLAVFLISNLRQQKATGRQRTAEQIQERVEIHSRHLSHQLDILEKIESVDPAVQQEIARSFERYRSDLQLPEGERLRHLLRSNADQIRNILTKASRNPEASSGSVIMFAVQKSSTGHITVKEVAATRIPPNNQAFHAEKTGGNRASNITGIVACAVAAHAFILWSGKWDAGKVSTTNIQAWDLGGRNRIESNYWNQKLRIYDLECEYQSRPTEDLHEQMLCAPVGLPLNSAKSDAAGAICVSYTRDLGILSEEWARKAINRYASSLSFTSWQKATTAASRDGTRRLESRR